MNKRTYRFLGLCAMFAGVTLSYACSDDNSNKSNMRQDIPVSRSEERIVEADNEFAYKLLSAIEKAELNKDVVERKDNIVFSPLSLSIALSMTANGASGDTREEILSTLGFGAEDILGLNSFNRKLLDKLPALDNQTTVSLANSVWIESSGHSVMNTDFVADMMKNYSSPIVTVENLSSSSTMQQINSWCSENTKGLIPEFLSEPLSANSIVALFNALYFKGAWTVKFKKELTSEKPFYNADGTAKRVPTMYNPAIKCDCFSDDSYTAVSFPYGNEAYSMIIVLPEEGVSLQSCIKEINPANISSLAKGEMFSSDLKVQIPKFEITYSPDLKSTLQSMGIKKAFYPNADFSNMWTNLEMHISLVKQTATIKVDEEGAEAAAVTIVGGGVVSPGPTQTNKFFVDRPFLFIISERSTGLPLFMGRVTKL